MAEVDAHLTLVVSSTGEELAQSSTKHRGSGGQIMAKIEKYCAAGVYDPPGYSQGTKVTGAQTILFLAGQVAYDKDGSAKHRGDFKGQAREVFTAVKALVEAGGGSPLRGQSTHEGVPGDPAGGCGPTRRHRESAERNLSGGSEEATTPREEAGVKSRPTSIPATPQGIAR